jgi:hypothetical protein
MIVGQKVVCIDATFLPLTAQYYEQLPVQDTVYVIRQVSIGISIEGNPGEVCLLLIGLHNPRSNRPPFPERGFNSERFRPLEEMQKRNHKEDVIAV